MAQVFLNREAELEIFGHELNTQNDQPYVVLLKAPTAYGKSRFTEELLGQTNRLSIRIKIPGYDADKTEQGEFLREIARQIDLFVSNETDESNLNDFMASLKSSEVRRVYNNVLRKKVFDIGYAKYLLPIKEILDRKSGGGLWDSKKLFQGDIADASIILAAYIKYILVQLTNIVVCIENIQQIDRESLGKLIELIESPGHRSYFILEYTESSNINIEYILDALSNTKRCIYKIYTLPPLSREYFHKLVGTDKKLYFDVVDYVYNEFRGNLRQGIDLGKIIKYSLESRAIDLGEQFLNPSLLRIRELKPNEQKILIAISTHQGQLSTDEINTIYGFSELGGEYISIPSAIAELVRRDLICREFGYYKISHDSITNIVLECFKSKVLVWFRFWSSYYEELKNSRDFSIYSRKSIVSKLFYYYLRVQPDKIKTLIPDIKELTIVSGSILSAKEFSGFIKNDISKSSGEIDDEVMYELVDILYYVGLFDEAYDIYRRINDHSIYNKIYEIALLDRLSRYHDVIKLSDVLLKNRKAKNSSREILLIFLIRFLSYRSLGDIASCKNILNEVDKLPNIKKQKEYGYYLRNREIILGSEEAMRCLREALDFFDMRHDHIESARIKLTLAMHLAFAGKINEAESITLDAKGVLFDNRMERHIVLNNLAAIRILGGQCDLTTLGYLQLALTTAYVEFDKTTVLANMLAVLIRMSRFDEAYEIADDLELLCLQQSDNVLLRFVHSNICCLYDKVGDSIKLAVSIKNLVSCTERIDAKWWHILNGSALEDCRTIYEYKCSADFITYWHFPINRV